MKLRFRLWHFLVIAVVLVLVIGYYAVEDQRNSIGPVGARNKAMLSGPFWGIQFEVDYMPGVAPDGESMNRLRGFVFDHTDKVATFVVHEIPSYASPDPADPTVPCLVDCPNNGYTFDQIIQIQERERDAWVPPGMISVHILYADRSSSEGEQIGASSYCATCIVMFPSAASANFVVEAIVLAHEFGHLLGLCAVNYEDVRNHCDGEGHSSNPNSLMYYAPDLDSPSVQALRLDADELADLQDLRTGTL
jgi:hypothetical protein